MKIEMVRIGNLCLLLWLVAGLVEAGEGATFSVLELPPVEGTDHTRIAVKWSGELPALLQTGFRDKSGHFVVQGSAMQLTESMNLLPLPPEPRQGDRAWQVVNAAGQVLAQQLSGPPGSGWQPGFFLSPGVDSTVRAMVEFQGELIVAGDFLNAGDQAVNRIARWDGATWSALGSPSAGLGPLGSVLALTVYDGALIAGGSFTEAGGVTVNGVARWDGTAWSPLSGPSGTGVNNFVRALTVYEGALIAGGFFNQAGGVTVNNVARWDGTAWSALSGPSGLGTDSAVEALTVYDGALIVGGFFTQAGGLTVNRIARWDGTAWSALGGPSPGLGPFGSVYALTVYDDALIAGGFFNEAAGVTVNNVARWDGTAWSALSGPSGTGLSNEARSLTVFDGSLIVGGAFTEAGGLTVSNLARWDGTAWSTISGPSGAGQKTVFSLAVFDGTLFAGGQFAEASGVKVNRVARWDGITWSALSGPSGGWVGGEIQSAVQAVTVYDGALIAGGNFTEAGGVTVNNVARWDGTAWSALSGPTSTGVIQQVHALTVYEGVLIAGGQFGYVAQWDGTDWSALGGPDDSDVNGQVLALGVYEGALIAGGAFSSAGGVTVNNVARWDGTAWSALSGPSGTGTSGGFVRALIVFEGALIVGGAFTEAGGVTVNSVARWDGTDWTALSGPSGIGANAGVRALTVFDCTLIAAGDFIQAGGVTVNRVASWDGKGWSALSGPSGTGVNNAVFDLHVYDGALVVAGLFPQAGGIAVNGVARWDGAVWTALSGPSGTGVNTFDISALAVYDGALIAGGRFSRAGGIPSVNIGEYRGGTVSAGTSVTDRACPPPVFYTIGGTVTGLAGPGLVLQNNGVDDLPIAEDGAFAFATALEDLSAYNVSILSEPGSPSQTCSVTNGSGNLAGADITNVEVTCVTDSYTVGGTVTGLSGSGLVLQNNAGDDLSISGNGPFTFATPLAETATYNVTVLTQPVKPTQWCSVANGSGQLAGADITNVVVSCADLNVEVLPSRLEFVDVDLGEVSDTGIVVVENTGQASVQVTGVGITGLALAEYTVIGDTCTASTLEAGEFCGIEVVFERAEPGPREAQLMIVIDRFAEPFSVELIGILDEILYDSFEAQE